MGLRKRMSRTLGAAALISVLAATAVLLGGCCSVGMGPCTITDRFVLLGGADLNACGEDERSHPVAVQFYALKGTKAFQGATFEEIWREPEILGGELVGEPEKVFVEPGGKLTIPLVRAADVTAIGVLANFCDRDDRSTRRYLFDELGKRGVKKQLVLRGISLSVE